MHTDSRPKRAFTCLELLVICAVLLLLASIALPLLAGNGVLGEQAVCSNNLRRIGHAFQVWANDHGDNNPWGTPVQEGGTFGTTNGLKGNAWFQMGTISNELASPAVLVCPSDVGVGTPRKLAKDFSSNPDGGFFSPGFRNDSLSYLIGLHSYSGLPRSVLSGDRNIMWNQLNVGCQTGIALACELNGVGTVWTNAIHGETGNILLNEGGVEQTSSARVRRLTNDPRTGSGSTHFLAPN